MLRPIALAPLALLFACGEEQLPQTAEETVTYALSQLNAKEDPGVLWDLLPPSYQTEVNGWCRRLATGLPGRTYDKLFIAMRKAGIVIKSQSEKILNFGPTRYAMAMARGADEDDMLAMMNAIANIPILLGDSDIATIARLKTVDVGQFLHETGTRMWQQGARAYRVTGESVGSSFESFTYKTIKSEGDRAQLEVELKGVKQLMAFTRVEGRWLPSDLVDNWAKTRKSVEGFLDSLDSPETQAYLKGMETQLDEVIADLDTLKAIKSRGKFANALTKLGKKYGEMAFGKLKFPW